MRVPLWLIAIAVIAPMVTGALGYLHGKSVQRREAESMVSGLVDGAKELMVQNHRLIEIADELESEADLCRWLFKLPERPL